MAELASFSNNESPLKAQFASAILTAIGFFFTDISFASEYIQKNFLEEHKIFFLVAIVLLAVGTLAGLLHVWIYYQQKEIPTPHEKKMNTYLGCVSLHLLYMGLTLWLAVMFVYSWSLMITIPILVTLAIAPLILKPIAIYIYHCKWLPAEPEPAVPEPAVREPAVRVPAVRVPAVLVPSVLVPAELELAQLELAQPELAQPDPAQPDPAQPAPAPAPENHESSFLKAHIASAILTAVGVFFTGLSFVSEHIHRKFLEEYVKFFFAAVVLLALGTLAGLFHVWNFYMGYPSDNERKMNTYLGHFSIYLLYMGLILWLVVMLVYSLSLEIIISILVAFAIAPLILIPIGKYIYHGRWN